MRVRRSVGIVFRLNETCDFDLAQLAAGGTGLICRQAMVAMAPSQLREVEVSADEIAALAALNEAAWQPVEEITRSVKPETLSSLLEKRLAVADHGDYADALRTDTAFRQLGWHALSACAHFFGRWNGVDSRAALGDSGFESLNDLLTAMGTPPPALVQRGDNSRRVSLLQPKVDEFGFGLQKRATCRNFDPQQGLALSTAADLLWWVFGAQGREELMPGHVCLKKNSPSAGGLHPTEAYIVAQRVAGLTPGIYHYRAAEHALAPVQDSDTDQLYSMALECLAGQRHFANAPLIALLSLRFERTLWKYREHSKALRAMILDVGHLSQNLYHCATHAGLGAFVTSAINEVQADSWLGLDPRREGVVAICGVGYRNAQRDNVEFDPLGRVWKS